MQYVILVLTLTLWSSTHAVAQSVPDRRPLLHVGSTITDIAQQPSGTVWITTREFELYSAHPNSPVWNKVAAEVIGLNGRLEVQQIKRLVFLSETDALAVGEIRVHSGDRVSSVVLQSQNGGRSWSPMVVSPDSLAGSDDVRQTADGMVFIVDQVGRYWISRDKGSSWTNVKYTVTLQNAGVKEMDMMTSQIGVAIDRSRSISFTTNAWQTVLPGRPSKRPIVRTQPHFMDQLAWARDLLMWGDRLVLVEGRDVYLAMMNDLQWERWDSVTHIAVSTDRLALYYLDVHERLWKLTSGETSPRLIAEQVSPPRIMRAAHGNVVLYRPDTGPVIFNEKVRTPLRLYASSGVIREPQKTVRDRDVEWGLDWQEPNDFVIDVYKRTLPKGQWQRDTFLYAGKTLLRLVGKDSLLFAERSAAQLYDVRTRQFKRYTLERPIEPFLKAPLASVRCVIERSTGDQTRRTWVDYRVKGGRLLSTEAVDSTAEGITSVTFLRERAIDEVVSLLKACNVNGNAFPEPRSIDLGQDAQARFRTMVDTIFRYDGYFDTMDLYRPPPSTSVQIEACKTEFLRYASEFEALTSERLGQAILSHRFWPSDREVRYFVEFINTAGELLYMEIDRSNEVHLPMLMPWSVTYRGQSWHWYNGSISRHFIEAFPPEKIPATLTMMLKPEWLLLAVAAFRDAENTGRIHRWYLRPWQR